jgi:hypothetical protein
VKGAGGGGGLRGKGQCKLRDNMGSDVTVFHLRMPLTTGSCWQVQVYI